MSDDSSRVTSRRKSPSPPKRSRTKFPLRVHKGTGYWCKKIRGHVFYFGKVADDPKGTAALEKYLREKDDLEAGRDPEAPDPNKVTVRDLVNHFLTHKEALRDKGELSPRTYRGYYDSCEAIVKAFGKDRAVASLTPDNFAALRAKLSKGRGAVSLRNEMQRCRCVFKFAFDQGLIATPVRYGQSFAKPKLATVRKEKRVHASKHGKKLFEAAEVRAILDAASQPLKAMVLLAINGGLGQTDLANLPESAIDGEWLDYPRPKTEIDRRIPLWPETIEAIREWIPQRPQARNTDDDGLLFLTVRGNRFVKAATRDADNGGGAPQDAIATEFNKVLARLDLTRSRRGFYALRHTFATIGGEAKDQVAVSAIMGHVDASMLAHYQEGIGDDRLRAVTNAIRAWLFAGSREGEGTGGGKTATLKIGAKVEGAKPKENRLKLFAG